MWNCCCTQYCNDTTEILFWVKVFYLKAQIFEFRYFKLLKVRITQQSYWNTALRACIPYETSEKQQILQEKRKTTQFKNINIRIWVRQVKFAPIRVESVISTHCTECESRTLDIQSTTVKTLSTTPGQFLCCLAFTSITHRGFMSVIHLVQSFLNPANLKVEPFCKSVAMAVYKDNKVTALLHHLLGVSLAAKPQGKLKNFPAKWSNLLLNPVIPYAGRCNSVTKIFHFSDFSRSLCMWHCTSNQHDTLPNPPCLWQSIFHLTPRRFHVHVGQGKKRGWGES